MAQIETAAYPDRGVYGWGHTNGAGTAASARTERVKPEVVAGTAMRLVQGKDEEAKSYLALNSSLSREEIDRAVAGLTQETEAVKDQVRAAAEKTAKYTQFALWATFFISIISLLTAVLGGRAAARHYLEKERTIVKV